MINHLVGIGNLSQGFAFVTLLPARFLPERSRAGTSLAPPSLAHRSTAAFRCSTVQAELAF
jgi:hypothetical protein